MTHDIPVLETEGCIAWRQLTCLLHLLTSVKSIFSFTVINFKCQGYFLNGIFLSLFNITQNVVATILQLLLLKGLPLVS
jgi:hypothetical protein